jgi:hypothetical protein
MKKKSIPDDCMPMCGSCAFYKADQGDAYGRCRRHPPVMVPEGEEYSFDFPVVNADDWCGSYVRQVN